MVRKAAEYLVKQGPSTPEDRWEEDAGLTAYTLGCMIAALLVAGGDGQRASTKRRFARSFAKRPTT